MCRVRIAIAILASTSMQFISLARAQQPGNYTCVVDDTTEVYNGDRTRGHLTLDLDGDESDPTIEVELAFAEGFLRLQNSFAGKALKSATAYKIVVTTSAGVATSIVGVANEPATGHTQVLVFMHNRDSGKYGFTLSTSRYATPTERSGESFAMLDVKLAHCTPA